MKQRILLIALLALLAAPLPALADGEAGAETTLSASDEEFLTNAPDSDLDLTGSDGTDAGGASGGQGIAVGEPNGSATGQSNVKYVYHGYSDTYLRRSIKDDRIDDGYIQGLLQRRGPK